MPTSLPHSVRSALGEEATTDFAQWFEASLQEHAVPRDEYRDVLSRLDNVKTRVGGVEKRLDKVEREVGALRREMNERFDKVDERFDQIYQEMLKMHHSINTMTRWAIGLLALFATLATALLALGQFAA